jgi:hypothetical protein
VGFQTRPAFTRINNAEVLERTEDRNDEIIISFAGSSHRTSIHLPVPPVIFGVFPAFALISL